MKNETTKKILKAAKADKTVKTKTGEEKTAERKAKHTTREENPSAGGKSLGALEAPVYNQEGKKVETVKLPESIFSLPWKADLVHQVVVSLMTNKRAN